MMRLFTGWATYVTSGGGSGVPANGRGGGGGGGGGKKRSKSAAAAAAGVMRWCGRGDGYLAVLEDFLDSDANMARIAQFGSSPPSSLSAQQPLPRRGAAGSGGSESPGATFPAAR